MDRESVDRKLAFWKRHGIDSAAKYLWMEFEMLRDAGYYREALYLLELFSRAPGVEDLWYTYERIRGDLYYALGEYGMSLSCYGVVLRSGVELSCELSLGCGACQLALCEYDKALGYYECALGLCGSSSDRVVGLLGQGECHRGNRDYGKALDSYRAALSLSVGKPVDVCLYLGLGDCSLRLEDTVSALGYYGALRECELAESDLIRLHLGLSEAYYDTAEYASCISSCACLLSLPIESMDREMVLLWKCRSHLALGEYAAGLCCCEGYISLSYAKVYILKDALACCIGLDDWVVARVYYDQLLSLECTDVHSWYIRGYYSYMLDEYAEAISSFIRCKELDSEFDEWMELYLGRSYYALDHYAAALSCFTRVCEFSDSLLCDYLLYAEMGDCCRELCDYTVAILHYARALSLLSSSSSLPSSASLSSSSEELSISEKLSDSEKLSISERFSELSALYAVLGECHNSLCDHTAALSSYARALSFSPGDPSLQSRHRELSSLLPSSATDVIAM
jgi:tetratricopeptide (TPR) repeat protein